MPSGPGTAAIFGRRGAQRRHPDHRHQLAAQRGNGQTSPHVAAMQIMTGNTVFGGLGGAGVHTECISWERKRRRAGRSWGSPT
jgi:hypothetical protein